MYQVDPLINAVYRLVEHVTDSARLEIEDGAPLIDMIATRNVLRVADRALATVGQELPTYPRWLTVQIDRAVKTHPHWECVTCRTPYPDDEGICSTCESSDPLVERPATLSDD